jgi:plasmid stabilization system protein ParE
MSRVPVSESKPAQLDIDHIVSYLGERNPRAALQWLDAYDKRMEQLSRFPFMGQAVDPQYLRSAYDGIRFLSFDEYIIFYYASEKNVIVSRVLHKKRDLKGLLMTFEVLPFEKQD